MKIVCESCSAQYDLDESRIPPSGMTMKCPACLHSFTVRKGSAAPPPPAARAGIELSPAGPELVDLPAPKRAHVPTISAPQPAPAEIVDLLAPVKARGGVAPAPPPIPRDIVDLPGLTKPPEVIDLLAPKRRSQVGIDLDAPDAEDDLGAPADAGPPGIELDTIDVVAPVAAELPVPKYDLPAPKFQTQELQPKAEVQEMAPRPETFEVVPRPTPEAPAASEPRERVAAPASEMAAPVEEPPRRARSGRARVAAAGVALLLGLVGVGLGIFTSSGYFGANLFSGRPAEAEQKMMSARKLLADDTLSSYHKAALELHLLVELEPKRSQAVALEAQARLAAARLGAASEAKTSDGLLAKLEGDAKAAKLPDAEKARALRALVAGKIGEARTQLEKVLAGAPADASALVYLGWTELQAGDAGAADHAFSKALAAESNRAAALYGLALSKEREGQLVQARELFARTLSRSASHFGAAVGQARTQPQPSQSKVEALIAARSPSVGTRELADAWTTVGMMAAQAGRRDEAEDRLKRALQLDPSSAQARVAMARVQCDTGRCKDALAALKKVVADQPRNLDARLMLVRALVDTRALDAQKALAAASEEAPKDARVAYLRGRVALELQEPPDRDAALKAFKEAIAVDPKYIAAYLAESQAFAQLGKSDDALEALTQAEARTSEDPDLMIELGQAYLGLGKAAEAEARFRAALEKRADSPAVRLALGSALEAQGRWGDARVEYDAVAKASAEWPGLAERQARLAARQGRVADAWQLFQKALQQGIPTQALRLAAADLALASGRLPEARKLIDSVVSEDDRSAPAQLLLARVQLGDGRPDEAMNSARRAATLADRPEAHLVLGFALEQLGKLDQAGSEFQLARRPPVEAEATLGRGRILVRLGASRDALAEVNPLFHDKALRARALLVAGDAYADQQQAEKARHTYEDAAKADPALAEAAFKFGRALHDAGRRKPCVTELDRALRLAGEKAPWATEAFLILGDAHRESHERDASVKAYRRYLALAAPNDPARVEVNRHLALLGEK